MHAARPSGQYDFLSFAQATDKLSIIFLIIRNVYAFAVNRNEGSFIHLLRNDRFCCRIPRII